MRSATLLLIAVASVPAALAAPADAVLIERRGTGAEVASALATGRSGGVLAWLVRDRVRAVSLDARGRPDGRARTLQAAGAWRWTVPTVAVAPGGEAVVAWRSFVRPTVRSSEERTCCAAVRAVVLSPRGRVRTADPLSVPGIHVGDPPAAAVVGNRAVVAWGDADQIAAASAPLDGPFTLPAELWPGGARQVALTAAPEGGARVIWSGSAPDGERGVQRLDVAAHGTPGTPVTLLPGDPRIAAAGDGTLLAVSGLSGDAGSARLALPGRGFGPARRLPESWGALMAAEGGHGAVVLTPDAEGPLRLVRVGPRGTRPPRTVARVRTFEQPSAIAVRGARVAVALDAHRRERGPAGSRVVRAGGRAPRRSTIVPGPGHSGPTALAFARDRLLVVRQTARGLELRRLKP